MPGVVCISFRAALFLRDVLDKLQFLSVPEKIGFAARLTTKIHPRKTPPPFPATKYPQQPSFQTV
jgi:hypothetical protein